MGVSIHYWAIPPQSTLFLRLQRDKAFAVLMAALFPYGASIFRFFEEESIDFEERQEILADTIERHGHVLGTDVEARRWIDEFRAELEQTRSSYPGIEMRRASLEKTSKLVEERLQRKLRTLIGMGAEQLVARLLYGDEELGRNLGLPDDEDCLGLVSPALVREGAGLLRQVDTEALFARDQGWEEYHFESFRRWRKLYLDAAEEGEALLLGVC